MIDAPLSASDEEREDTPVLHAAHAAQRTAASTIAFYGAFLALCGSLFIPSVSEALGVTAMQALVAVVGAALVSTAAALIYRKAGVSKSYFVADALETYALQATFGYLIYEAGSSRSFFWLLYACHVPIIASSGTLAHNRAVVIGMPSVLALARILDADLVGVAVSIVAGATGYLAYTILARVTDELEASRQREAELKRKLVEIGASRERGRIAQDLHDSVGAQLAGLVWRVRALATRVNGPVQGDLAGVENRIVATIQELREVVMSLRKPQESWITTIELLRERCSEISGDLALDFHAPEAAPVESHDVYAEMPPVIFELVRNAARHARATKVAVSITPEPGAVRIRVSDDGKGLGTVEPSRSPGGLGNVWRRVSELAGSVEIGMQDEGTRFDVTIPVTTSASAPRQNRARWPLFGSEGRGRERGQDASASADDAVDA